MPAVLTVLACAGIDAPAVAACLNAARRAFDGDAQRRARAVPTHGGARVHAYSPVVADACSVRTTIDVTYAVSKGVQGRADPAVELDFCLIARQLSALRARPLLFWNGSKPNLQAWRSALIRHDGASRGGKAHGMLRGLRKASDAALRLGFGGPGPRAAWRPFGTCAVVGGAPSLAAARNGAQIDAHDAVFRFNDHPAGGPYARAVGNRTTLRVLNALYAAADPPAAVGGRTRGEGEARVLQTCQSGRRIGAAIERAAADGHARRHLIEPEVYRAFYEHFGSGGLTGAIAVWFALAACSSVTLYGFSSPCELGAKYTHYHSAINNMERVQVNTVKVALWTHALRCAGLVRWAGPRGGDHWCAAPAEAADT